MLIPKDLPVSVGPLWLASASPRRVALLQQLGVPHRQRVTAIDETPVAGEAASDYVLRMAREKARALWVLLMTESQASRETRVLAADTTVHVAGHILGKPVDEAEFTGMMQRLSGVTHEVLTAVALLSDKCEAVRLSVTQVRFKVLTTDEIRNYWLTGEPKDKAGGYAIQGFGAAFIEHLAGSYSGVMGLPLYETAELLQCAELPIWRQDDRS